MAGAARYFLSLAVFLAIFFSSLPAAAYCSAPSGPAGTITFNADNRVMQYCNGSGWQAMGDKTYYRPYANFFSELLSYDMGTISGLLASKVITFSMWFRRIDDFGTAQYMFSDTGPRFAIFFDTANKLNIQGGSTSANNRLAWKSTSAVTDTDWHHLVFSFDLATAGSMKVYIDDVQDSATPTTFSGSANISFNTANNWIGSKDGTSTGGFIGDLSEIWISDNYIDLTVTANRRLFIDADKRPVELKEDVFYWQGEDWLNDWQSTYNRSGPAPGPGDLCPTQGQFLWKAGDTVGGYIMHSFAWGNYVVSAANNSTGNNNRIHAFTWNGTTLTLKEDHYYPHSPSDIWGDGTYFYVTGDPSGGGIDAYSFNGSTVTSVGDFDTGSNAQFVWGDGTYIYVIDGNNEKLYALTFDGSNFTKKGEITIADYDVNDMWGGGGYIYIANNGNLEAYTFDGSNFTFQGGYVPPSPYWVRSVTTDGHYIFIGANMSGGDGAVVALTFDGTNFSEIDAMDAADWSYAVDLASIATANGYVFVTCNDGGIFALRFDESGFHKASLTWPDYSAMSVFADQNYVYVSDYSTSLDIYSGFGPCTANCASPTENAGTLLYNSTSHVPQYCDGKNWQAIGPVPGTGGAGCSGSSEGTMFYDADAGVMKYCDGNGWIPVGQTVGNINAAPTSGLIHHWTFDETSGTTVHDSAGTADGTLSGTPYWWSGSDSRGSGVFYFDGATTASVPDAADLRLSSGKTMTIAVWVKPDDPWDNSWRGLFSKCRNAGGWYGLWKSDDPYWDFVGVGQGDLYSDIMGPVWQHVVLVIDTTSRTTAYLNGVLVGSAPSTSGTAGTCTDPLILGGTDIGDEYFKGDIDDIRIYNRALTPAEVKALYNGS